MAGPTAEERESFRFGGTRARPRKGIEAVYCTGQARTDASPPVSHARLPDLCADHRAGAGVPEATWLVSESLAWALDRHRC